MKKQQVVNPYLLMQMEERNKKEEEEARREEQREQEQKAKEGNDSGNNTGSTGSQVERQLIQLIDDELLVRLNLFTKENRLAIEGKEASGTDKQEEESGSAEEVDMTDLIDAIKLIKL